MADDSKSKKQPVDPLQDKSLPEKKPFAGIPGRPYVNTNPAFNKPGYGGGKFGGGRSGGGHPVIRKHAARSR